MNEFKAFLIGVVCGAFIVGVVWTSMSLHEKCEAKGGTYLSGQCVNVQVIK